jgi:3-methylfumaryl-CoA hydratase
MAFVTVREELYADNRHVATEEKDIVYRSEPDGGRRRQIAAPGPADAAGTPRRVLFVDPVLLFRFSALTYNAHRIHYDLPYATEIEGYPGLVVHGPLLALLALEPARLHRPDAPVRAFDYRLVHPAFAPAEIAAVARPRGEDGMEVAVGVRACEPSLTATLTFADSTGGKDRS